MANNQLQVYQGMAFGELTTQDVATIRETIAKDANDSQFRLFMGVAKSSGANPLTNEIYAAVRSGQLTIQYGYDLYIRKAKEADGYLGYDVQLIHENDEFKLARKHDDQGRSYLDVEKHDIGFPRGKVIGGYAIAYREGLPPMTVPMEIDEVEHFKKSNIGMQKTMWTNYFSDMFKKHILKRALKQQFGLEFDDHTVEQGNGAPEQPRERKDITPNQEVIDNPTSEQSETKPEPEDKIASLRKEMKQKFVQLGITTNKAIGDYIKKNNVQLSDPATEAELIGLIGILDMNIEMQQATASDDDILE